MSGTVSGLFFPICSMFFCTLLLIIYFSKERINIKENYLYSLMLISSFVDSLCVVVLQIVANKGINHIEYLGVVFNKIDYICLITYSMSMFLYVLLITFEKVNQESKKMGKGFLVIYLINIGIILLAPLELMTDGNYITIRGFSTIITFVSVGIYLVLSFLITIINIKRINKKHLPVLLMPLFIMLLMVLFVVSPYLVIISIVLTFLNYIMFFTIENPDIKMIEEIKKANDLSEKYNNDKSKFIFNMTQQVRYPLNSIDQKIEQAKEMDNIEDIKLQLESIQGDEKRISNIINGTLNVTTIDSKKIKIVESEYNLSNLLKEITIKSEKMASAKNLEFRTNIDESIPMFLYGDSIRMKQLINSIISNSVKYTNEGFVELDVSTIKTYDICRLIISVKDSGIGLKTEEIDKLFSSNDNEDIGSIDETDIKLDVVKKLVNIIGGTITVQSEKNKGSEFTIVVDQKIVNDNSKYAAIIESYEKATDKKKILFVSEKEQQQDFYRKRLLSDYNVEIAKNGQECLEKIRKGEVYDVIIISEEMSKLSAIDIMNKLKGINNFDIKTYILCENEDEKRKYKESGFVDVLKTDMSLKSLKEKIGEK